MAVLAEQQDENSTGLGMTRLAEVTHKIKLALKEEAEIEEQIYKIALSIVGWHSETINTANQAKDIFMLAKMGNVGLRVLEQLNAVKSDTTDYSKVREIFMRKYALILDALSDIGNSDIRTQIVNLLGIEEA